LTLEPNSTALVYIGEREKKKINKGITVKKAARCGSGMRNSIAKNEPHLRMLRGEGEKTQMEMRTIQLVWKM
jgi:hypothetical protein